MIGRLLGRRKMTGLHVAMVFLNWRNTWKFETWSTPPIFGWSLMVMRQQRGSATEGMDDTQQFNVLGAANQITAALRPQT